MSFVTLKSADFAAFPRFHLALFAIDLTLGGSRPISVTSIWAKMTTLTPIPIIDIRNGGTLRHAREGQARAHALRNTCLAWFPRVSRPLLPMLDFYAKRWLTRSRSPYVDEIGAIAAALGFPGIWFLNGSYQWCCTALAREEGAAPWLVRTLDWPFPGLGRYAEIAHMRGPAGDFFNVTWPGYVGALTALAPGRFAAAINQAPMRRRTHGRLLRLFDLGVNAVGTLLHVREIPPDQLLRQVFETCRSFDEAKHRLETTPVARPVIFTLIGCAPGERCVIERMEHAAQTREDETAAANDWLAATDQWEARIGGGKLFTSTFADAAENSRTRRQSLSGWPGSFASESFSWVAPPVLNPFTRIAVEMCPANGILRAVGYESRSEFELPEPVTLPTDIAVARAAA